MATVVLTNGKTEFDANTNAAVSVSTNTGNADDNTQRITQASVTNLAVGKVAPTTSEIEVVAARAGRISLHIKNYGTETVFISGSAATDNDYPLQGGEAIELPFYAGTVRAKAEAGTADVRYLEKY